MFLPKEEALKIYEEHGYEDKAHLLRYRPENTVHFYECNGYLNYMFGYMVPKTGYIKEYKLRLYDRGFIMQYPRAELGGTIPEFKDAPTFSKALRQANNWGKLINGSYVSMMNQMIEEGRDVEFINLCETKHNGMLAELGNQIKNNIKRAWWKRFVQQSQNSFGVDAAILMNSRVWEASGHTASFSDPKMDCKECKARFRADKLIEEWAHDNGKDMIADGKSSIDIRKYAIENNLGTISRYCPWSQSSCL